VALFFAEILVYWSRFHAPLFAKITWPGIAHFASYSVSARFVITVAIAFVTFSSCWPTGLYRAPLWHLEKTVIPWKRLLVHLAAFAAFYQLSVSVFEAPSGTWTHRDPWIGIWLVTGLLASATWIAAAVPMSVPSGWVGAASKIGVMSLCVGLAAAWAAKATEKLWPLLASGTTGVVERLLGCFYPVVTRPANYIVGTDSYAVQISPKCSGIQGIGLITVFLIAFLWWFRRKFRFPQVLVLIPIGIAAIWCANAVRITALIAIGTSISPEIAQHGFHNQSGWLMFNAITLGLVAVAWNSPALRNNTQHAALTTAPAYYYPAAPYLVPFLGLLVTVMLAAAFSPTQFDRFYALRVVAVMATLIYFRSQYRQLQVFQWTWSWQPIAIGCVIFAFWMLNGLVVGGTSAVQSEHAAGLAAMSSTMAVVWLVSRSIGSVITVPIAEELAFRGYLTRRLAAADFESVPLGRFTWFSFLASSVLFGLMHDRWIAGILAGALLAAALYRRKLLMDAVVAHATANALLTGYVLITGDWVAWS
jgi:exosortase E/protease (VPEID-CTERM system)